MPEIDIFMQHSSSSDIFYHVISTYVKSYMLFHDIIMLENEKIL